MPAIDVAGSNLVYTASGSPDAPPLMLLHDWQSHRGVWQRTVTELEHHFYCISPDLPGTGDSAPPPDGDYSLRAQAQRILWLADALMLNSFTLMGHALGAQVSMCIAGELAPTRVTRLISVAGMVTGSTGSYVRAVTYPGIFMCAHVPLVARLIQSVIHVPAYARRHFAPWFYHMDLLPFDTWAEDRRRAVQPSAQMALHRTGQALKKNVMPLLPAITAPALVIHGVQDRVVPSADALLFQQHVPDSQLILLEECGHFPMYEKFCDYMRALKVFLGQTSGNPQRFLRA